MKVCVIGLGYIGLPTAAMFANAGHEVLGVDKKPQIVEALNRGEIIIEENGLAEFIKAVVDKGHLRAALDPETSDAYIISVPTPITEDKKADMRFVESATRSVVPLLKKGDLVILESTSPVGTVDSLMLPILEESGLKAGRDFGLGHSPERVIPGKILFGGRAEPENIFARLDGFRIDAAEFFTVQRFFYHYPVKRHHKSTRRQSVNRRSGDYAQLFDAGKRKFQSTRYRGGA